MKGLKVFIGNVNFTFQKQDFSTSISETRENISFSFMIGFPWNLYSHIVFFDVMRKTPNSKYLLEFIKKRFKAQGQYMSCERAQNLEQ